MYFRLKNHRRYILMGNENIESPNSIREVYRTGPILANKSLNQVLARKIGNMNMYAKTVINPNDSRSIIFDGNPVLSIFTQKYSDRFTLFKGTTL